jgi:amino acid transporter
LTTDHIEHDDASQMKRLGYAQELYRHLRGVQNFAISFSIIGITVGCTNSFHQALSSVGGAAIGLGWWVGCALSAIFALGMAQIGSAFPTAGGLYHWASILGGRGLGWLTAWLNMMGLVVILSSTLVGTHQFFMDALGGPLGWQASRVNQAIWVVLFGLSYGVVNHFGIRLTARLTDFSGLLIFVIVLVLSATLLLATPQLDWSRLVQFDNFSGAAGGDVWPTNPHIWQLFALGLVMPLYTMTGFDASAHTAEETQDASRNVPKAILHCIIWATLMGGVLVISLLLAIPDLAQTARLGSGAFVSILNARLHPQAVVVFLYLILVTQWMCGLALVTSCSRMINAFARDGGLPASQTLRRIHPRWLTPVAAIWVVVILSVLIVLLTPDYTTLVSVALIFLFISYGLPILAGWRALGRRWAGAGRAWGRGTWGAGTKWSAC